jgi:Concanavalin A-like lectin/glucanases superfamily/Secretion system C-terminal sorting domain
MKTSLLTIVFIAMFSVINAQNVPAYVPKTGLVGWWPFNGNANDESGNGNHGMVNGALMTTDRNSKANSAYSFYGIDDFIDIQTNNGSFDNQQYTISYWFKSNINASSTSGGPNVNPAIISRLGIGGPTATTASTDNFVIYEIGGSNHLNALVHGGATGANTTLGNIWNNIVFSVRSDSTFVYLNGKKLYSNLNGGLISYKSFPIRLGRSQDTYWKDLSGELDDIAIYNRALSDSEIKALYTGEVTSAIPSYVPKTGLVGWWPFNGNANDESGNGNHGVVNGASLTADRNSKANSAYNFNGTNKISVPSNSSMNFKNFSLSFYLKSNYTTYGGNKTAGIIGKGSNLTNKLLVYIGNTGYIGLECQPIVQQGTASNGVYYNNNVWHNIVFTVEAGGLAKIYINGVFNNQTSFSSQFFSDNSLPLQFGDIDDNWYSAFIGQLDDIALFNRVLTQEEITNLYRGTTCTTPLATITPKGATTFLSGGSTELTATTGTNYTYEWYLNNVLISGATTSSYKATASGSYTVKVMDGTCSATSAPVVIKVVPKLSEGVITVVAPPTVKQNGLVEVVLSTSTLDSLHKVIAYQTDFSYDSTRFTYVSSSLVGTLNPTGTVQVNSSVKGKLNVGFMSPKVVVGTGTLVKLTFKASLVMGSTPFGLSNFLYNATPVTKLVGDTISIIDGIPPTGKITYSVNPARKGDSLVITVAFNEKMAISPIPQLELTGQNIKPKTNMTRINETTYQLVHVVEKGSGIVNIRLYTGTDLAKNIVTALPTTGASFSVIPPVYGDIDTNKFIQAYDAAIALQYSVGLNAISHIDPSPWSNWRVVGANVDTVAGVTANDASLILQKSVGQLSSFPADGLKRSVQEMGDVEIIQVKNQLFFKAKGSLQGFNFDVKNIHGVLGEPEFINNEMMVAENRNGSDFRIGIAKAGKFKEGEIFMKLNLKTDAPVKLLASINVNTRKVERLIDGNIVSKTKYVNAKNINVYPNPVKNIVTISGAEGYELNVFNIEGRMVYTTMIDTDYFQAQFKESLPTGLYIMKLASESEKNTEEYKLMVE